MFQRLARNFVKNGYFPTDEVTLTRLLNALAPTPEGKMALFDPTAGEGVALAECKQRLGAERALAYGIEIDEERAYHAKTLLDDCIHGSLMDCTVSRHSFGLLFFNPPYGDLSADKTGDAIRSTGRERLEKSFYRRVCGMVQPGGVMVMIIPQSTLDKEFAKVLTHHWRRVQVFLAPEQRFKQIVFFGVRQEPEEAEAEAAYHQLIKIGQGESPPVLPENWGDAPYVVPAMTLPGVTMQLHRLDERQLAEVVQQSPGLWSQFAMRFERESQPARRPLTDLSQWHLALALAAGQVSGLVRSRDGRAYLIRGSTYKRQTENIQVVEDEDGRMTECRVMQEHFVPVLRALDITHDSPSYGSVLTLK